MKRLLAFAILISFLSACSNAGPASLAETGKPQVIATTTVLADVVSQVGGDYIQVTSLLPPGADAHAFEPTPQDLARLSQAQVIFANGFGLEANLIPFFKSAGVEDRVVETSQGIQPRSSQAELAEEGNSASPNQVDPHVWLDPNNVILWTENIAARLSELDPAHASDYQANAQAYQARLKELDAWIKDQVAQVPQENRSLVVDHLVFGYFADRYGFTQVGTVVPGYSSQAEPSAQELAALEQIIRSQGVKAVFLGNTVSPTLSKRVADDTGIQLVKVYTESLSEANGDAPTYLDYMRFDVQAFVNALR